MAVEEEIKTAAEEEIAAKLTVFQTTQALGSTFMKSSSRVEEARLSV